MNLNKRVDFAQLKEILFCRIIENEASVSRYKNIFIDSISIENFFFEVVACNHCSAFNRIKWKVTFGFNFFLFSTYRNDLTFIFEKHFSVTKFGLSYYFAEIACHKSINIRNIDRECNG